MKKILCILLVGLLLTLTACSASEMDSGNKAGIYEDGIGYTDSGASTAETDTLSDRKLVKNVEMQIETKQFDKFVPSLERAVNDLGGYVESSQLNSPSGATDNDRRSTVVVRVPAEKLDEFFAAIGDGGTVTYKKESVSDITSNYIDTESRIKALKGEQETLLELLKSATNLSDVLEIQKRLSTVTAELESYQGQLNAYDNQVEFSAVTIDIVEVDREASAEDSSFWGEIGTKLGDNLYSIGQAARTFTVWLISSLPYFAIIAAIVIVIVLWIRIALRRKRRRNEANLQQNK